MIDRSIFEGVVFDPDIRHALVSYSRRFRGSESCAALFGEPHGDFLRICHFSPLRNLSADRDAFRVNRTQIHRLAKEVGACLAALYHSHSRTLWPSRADCRAMAETDLVWVIGVGGARTPGGPDLHLRGYECREGRVHSIPVHE